MKEQLFNPDIDVTMPDEVLKKIQYLCYMIPKVEWSGILFYAIEGDIIDPENFKITLKDILPMDMGSSAYTEYELDHRYVDYLMDNPEALDWKMGHIHSHNTMNVFFSGTDMLELHDNSPNHNYYLSLIVNNFNDFCAKLSYVAETEIEEIEIKYSALNSNGDSYTVGIIPAKIQQKLLCIHDCNIITTVKQLTAEESFADKVAEIMKPKIPKVYNRNVGQPGNLPPTYSIPVKVLDDNPLSNPNLTEDRSDVEIFFMTLLNFTNVPSSDDTVDSLLDDIEALQVTAFDLASSIMTNFLPVYEKLFSDVASSEHYLSIIEETIDEVGHYEDVFPILKDVIPYLQEIRNKYLSNPEELVEND